MVFSFLAVEIVSRQPALPSIPQRPAVMAGNEVLSLNSWISRLSGSHSMPTDIVPSTSSPHKFRRRDPQVSILK